MNSLHVYGIILVMVTSVKGHGYLSNPPQRSSAWKAGYDVPTNYNHNQLNCGGFGYQWSSTIDGRCGVCGDPYNQTLENEIGGKYATGTITGSYVRGSLMSVTVTITASHLGWFEFRLCPFENATQACLNQTLLRMSGSNETRYVGPVNSAGNYTIDIQLPDNITCENCVLQWKYNTGNSYGCEEGTGCAVGLGKQEQFINCADIRIYDQSTSTSQPTSSTTTSQPTSSSTTTTSQPTSSSTTTSTSTTTTSQPTSTTTPTSTSTTTTSQSTSVSNTTVVTSPVTTETPSPSCTGLACVSSNTVTCKPVGIWTQYVGMEQWCLNHLRLSSYQTNICFCECC